jgi:hypothetical protein
VAVISQTTQRFSPRQMLKARCPICSERVNWRHAQDRLYGTCCEQVFDARAAQDSIDYIVTVKILSVDEGGRVIAFRRR